MKILKHPVFYGFVFLATSIYMSQRLNLPIANWVSFYVNDFLCLPIVLSICLMVIRAIKKTETLYVPFVIVMILTTFFALFFECIMPEYSNRYTYDPIDIGLYFLGACLFYGYQRKLF